MRHPTVFRADTPKTFWAWISLDLRRQILVALATVIVIAVRISRIHLGVHYPAQVIGGWGIGLAVAGVGIMTLRHLPPRTKENSVMPQALFVAAILAPVAAASMLGVTGQVHLWRIGGYLFGFWLGTVAEARYVHFTAGSTVAQKILRIGAGGAITGFLVLALGRTLPETYVVSSFANSVVQGVAVALIAPALFNMIERGRTQKK